MRGYATASTNTGHQATTGLDAARFGFESREKLIDFAYRAQHETAVVGKALVEAFYGRPPEHSYFIGNSTGGVAGLMEAQRFPGDYDGIVAGQPLNQWTRLMTALVDAMAVLAKESSSDLSGSALELLHRGVLAACDSTDGVMDGVLEDPRRCAFDPLRLQCSTTHKAEECLSPSQVAAVRHIYGGLKEPATGAQIFPGLAFGSELLWRGAGNPHTIPISHYRWLVFRDPKWDWRTFQITDSESYRVFLKAEAELGPLLNATNPDLRAFRARGGKLIHYHGWGDPAVASQSSIDYFESVVSFFGGGQSNRAAGLREVATFYRLFMIPGLSHTATDEDVQGALEQWVEQGTAPEMLVATVAGAPLAKHLLCSYPKIAVYSGREIRTTPPTSPVAIRARHEGRKRSGRFRLTRVAPDGRRAAERPLYQEQFRKALQEHFGQKRVERLQRAVQALSRSCGKELARFIEVKLPRRLISLQEWQRSRVS